LQVTSRDTSETPETVTAKFLGRRKTLEIVVQELARRELAREDRRGLLRVGRKASAATRLAGATARLPLDMRADSNMLWGRFRVLASLCMGPLDACAREALAFAGVPQRFVGSGHGKHYHQ